MASVTAISFETDGIRIISGVRSGEGFTPENALFIAESELEAFLQSDSASSYLVAISPADTIYETVTIPPTDPKLTPLLARNEIARLHPELKSFSCALQVVGDIPVEGRTIRKVACCLVPAEEIRLILEPFIRQNKTVEHLVAAPFALAPLLATLEDKGQGTILCAFDGGVSKTLFLAEDGAVVFARSISSNTYGWDLLDRQNVTMTLDYCFQSLRMRPSKVITLNPSGDEDPDAPPPRMMHLPPPPGIAAAPDLLLSSMIPLMLAATPLPASSNLLPQYYREQITRQTLLKRVTMLFIAGSLLLMAFVGLRFHSVQKAQNNLASLKRQEAGLEEIYQAHQEAQTLRNADQPLITAMNGILSPPDIPRFLSVIGNVRTTGVTISKLSATRDKESLTVQLAGTTSGNSFSAGQIQFESYLAALRQMRGISVTTQQMDIKTGAFTIGASYRP